MRILVSLLVIFIGFILVWKSEWFFQNFGTIPFFEKYLHSSGGGRLGYKLVGIGGIFAGILIMTNLYSAILTAFANLFVPGA